jgi:DNA-directed RNA polymerase specialized sigma24 family protein
MDKADGRGAADIKAINKIIDGHMIEEMVENIGVKECYKDDLIQEVYLALLQQDQERLNEIDEKGELRYFVSKIITNQYCSVHSPFYYQIMRYNKLRDERADPDPKDVKDDNE